MVIDKIKEKIREIIITTDEQKKEEQKKIVIVDSQALKNSVKEESKPEPDLRIIGLFSDVSDEKIAEIAQAMLYFNEVNRLEKHKKNKKPIEFYLNTYGGSAEDMFALYDIMGIVKKDTEIHTIGVGKVMSAGVLLLAAGTPGKRKIGKHCRIMIHNVMAVNHGMLPTLANELNAITKLQETYIETLVECTKLTKKRLKKMLNEKVNIYLDAEKAIKLGIVDEII